MAARLNPKNVAMVRDRIRVVQLVDLLQKDGLGKKKLSPGQRDSIKYLVSQAIGLPPQMSEVNFTGQMEINEISDKPLTAEQWAAEADNLGTTTGASSPTH